MHVRRWKGITTNSPGESAPSIAIAACCLVIILALVVGVGVPDRLVFRHLVQTLPLWAGVALGFRQSKAAGWVALPSFLFWLLLMALGWLYLLGVVHFVNGHFSPLDIAMTIVVAAAAMVGIATFRRFTSAVSVAKAAGLLVIFVVFQLLCFFASFLPAIAHR